MLNRLRLQIPYEEFDYNILISALSEYKFPRDKITDLLRKGSIIRVKKGLYVFGELYRKQPYSREILANLIYGPSYISLEYAFQYYGMIPEQVNAVTSVTTGRTRKFSTPVGLFSYKMIPLLGFQTGMDRVVINDKRSFLIALPEKALADKIRTDRIPLSSQKEMQFYLLENLRLDMADLINLSPDRLEKYAENYHSGKILLLSRLIRFFRRNKKGHNRA